MAVTEDRLAAPAVARDIAELERLWQAPAARPRRAPARWRRAVGGSWLAVFLAIGLFEPTPSNPDAAIPAWGAASTAGFFVLLAATVAGLARRRAWAFATSAAAGLVGAALAYACRASGHHLGSWWLAELGMFAAVTAVSLGAGRAARRA
jgi:hypothetical protein